ncbi:hypothetical protein CWC29_016285 [Pseudoalteromonas sp. S4498]|uniref:hypothetical protein n=1 Tax=Pseudoalteromonas galatheae TaxID=579562 RepID=UPI001109EA52|nr:hypothetical protein [Pseudoalteromonas galatheae]NKC20358.1 hypothetical protein [Pseudoalteromonas galatheae]
MSSKFKVIYVDEDPEARTDFKLNFVNKESCDLIIVHPEFELDDMVEFIIAESPEAVVTDFRLKDKEPQVTYDGVDLIKKIKEIKSKLPCFVLTSYEGEAINVALDVNWIHDKEEIHEDENDRPVFSQKVIQQIHVNRGILERLLSKKQGLFTILQQRDLTEIEERELVELSNEIEMFIFNDIKIPKEIKSYDGLAKLDSLISLSDRLLEEIDKN